MTSGREAAGASGLGVYYLLLATQTVSQVGSRIGFFAVGIAVFTQTSHATPIAIIAFCQTLPWIVGAGRPALRGDRRDRSDPHRHRHLRPRHRRVAGGAHPDAGEDRAGRGDGARGLAPGVRRARLPVAPADPARALPGGQPRLVPD